MSKMTVSAKQSRFRFIVGRIILILGLSHSLYYLAGMIGGWEIDGWNLLMCFAGIAAAGLGALTIHWRTKPFAGREKAWIAAGLAAAFLVFASFVFIESFILQAAVHKDNRKADVLLILGARVRGEHISLSLKNRLDEGLAYLQRFPDTPVVVSGGKGAGEDITEAEAMKRYLIAKGIPSKQILKEDRSTNTFENILFSKQLLQSKSELSKSAIMIVTSDFHMYRAKMLAGRADLQVYGYPAKTPLFTRPKEFVREYAALIKSFFFDRNTPIL